MASSPYSKREWEWLPQDLLIFILEKSVTLSDYIRFTAVCKPWRSSGFCSGNNEKLMELSCNQPPLLVMANAIFTPRPQVEHMLCNFYSVTRKKVLSSAFDKFSMPDYGGFIGSSHGWVIVLDYINNIITLYNPFYTQHDGKGIIHLPPITLQEGKNYGHRRGLLSVDPAISPNDYICFFWGANCLAFFRARDKTWTFIDEGNFYSDGIYSGDLFYALCGYGSIISCDISATVPMFENVAPAVPNVAPAVFHNYVVESFEGGDLLQVVKLYEYNRWNVIAKFMVFRLVFDDMSGETKWVEISSLGGGSLFMDCNTCIYVSTSDYPECRPNSIYFIHDMAALSIFDLEDGSIRPLYQLSAPFPYHTWLVPKFQRNTTIKDLN